jgi:hypothetical protein
MNSTKSKIYDPIVSNVLQQIDLYDHNASNLYKTSPHTGNTVELVKEQLWYDIKYKGKR